MYDEGSYGGNSLRNRVYLTVKERILNGEYQLGEALVELKLSEEFSVSRTPVREALRQLELDGLVHSIQNKGVMVTGVSQKDIGDVYEMRKLIEGLASRWAAETITEEEKIRMKETLDLCEFYTMKGDHKKVLEYDSHFHETIFQASKSKPLNLMLRHLHEYVQRARNASLSSDGRAEAAFEEHKGIYEAILHGDGVLAEQLTAEHIARAKESLLKTWRQITPAEETGFNEDQ